jgi:poly(3-hydroxybutyrate) depolymerase
MLYKLHDELHHAILAPLAAFTNVGSAMFSHPASPFAYTPVSRQIAAGYELIYRIGKKYEKPEWHLPTTTINDKTVAVNVETEMATPFCNLIHFKRDLTQRERNADPKLLIVAPLSGHHSTLLRDTVRALLPNHEVYVTDWVDARMVPLSHGPFHLNDYVKLVRKFIQHLAPQLNVMSVCQPTVPVLAAISLMASDKDASLPKSMVMMGGPIDPRCSPTQVNRLATNRPFEWFEDQLIHAVPDRHPGFGRKVYPGFLQHAGFMSMNPDRHLKSHYDFYLDLLRGDEDDAEAHRRFYNEYNAVLDMPAEFYLDTIKTVFQNFDLPNGTWEVDGQLVNPADIKTVALFTIEGELDDISGEGQTRAAQDLCKGIPASRKKHYTAPNCGHYGIFSGSRWRNTICPQIAEFIRKA